MNDDLVRRIRNQGRRLGRTEAKTGPLYLEDVYTPTYFGSATAGTTTYTTQEGAWTRIGRVVFFNCRVTWTAATGTGNAQVSIPFTPSTTASGGFHVGVWSSGLTFANNNVVGRIITGQAFFTFQSLLTNAGATASAVEAAGDIIASGWFTV